MSLKKKRCYFGSLKTNAIVWKVRKKWWINIGMFFFGRQWTKISTIAYETIKGKNLQRHIFISFSKTPHQKAPKVHTIARIKPSQCSISIFFGRKIQQINQNGIKYKHTVMYSIVNISNINSNPSIIIMMTECYWVSFNSLSKNTKKNALPYLSTLGPPPRIHLTVFRTGTVCVLVHPYITIQIFTMQKMSYFIPPYIRPLFMGEFMFHRFCIWIRFFKSKNMKKSKLKSVFAQTLKNFFRTGKLIWIRRGGT